MPSRTELRYFRRSEEGGARAVAATLVQAGLAGVQPKYVAGYEDSTALRPCHYEPWLVPDAGTK